VPFINKRALGAVAGIVGAGGNVGAVAAGFLFKSQAITWPTAMFILGTGVVACSFAAFAVTFNPEAEYEISPALPTQAEPAYATVAPATP
jgi:NNP family nitrate/nitrite transporter-like MFS transporter